MKRLSKLWDALVTNRRQPGFNVLRVASAVLDGETVTFGPKVFEVDTEGTANITAGRIRVDLSGSPTAAAAARVLTLTGLPLADETVTIGARVYTFKAALTAANQVLIGANASDSLDNLIAAINGAAGAGTLYGAGTVAHAQVIAAAGAGDTMSATAKAKGTAGNSIASTETLTNGSWAGATLTGGADPTAAEFTTAFELAVNAAGGLRATRISANEVLVLNGNAGTFGNALACSETLSGANNAWAQATTYGHKSEPEEAFGTTISQRVPNAQEVAVGNMHFLLDFEPKAVFVQVNVTATGIVKAWNGGRAISGRRITLDNSGATDWAETDTVTILASA